MSFKQLILFVILLISAANSQSWQILTIDDNRFKLDSLSIVKNDTLFVTESGETVEIPIENISSIWNNKFKVVRGILGVVVGAGIGTVIGFVTGKNVEESMTKGLAIGAIAGGIIFSIPIGKHYILDNMTLEQKVDKINTLIEIYEK